MLAERLCFVDLLAPMIGVIVVVAAVVVVVLQLAFALLLALLCFALPCLALPCLACLLTLFDFAIRMLEPLSQIHTTDRQGLLGILFLALD